MKKSIKGFVKKIGLYGLIFLVRDFVKVVRNRQFQVFHFAVVTLVSHISKRNSVVIYFESSIHESAFGDILSLLNSRLNNHRLFVFTEFEASKSEMPGVQYIRRFPSYGVPFLSSKIFISSCAKGNNMSCPFFSTSIYQPHSLVEIEGVFPENAFDGHDVILAAGTHQTEDFLRTFKRNGVRQKVIVRSGYPKLDAQIREVDRRRDKNSSGNILFAPTLVNDLNETTACLRASGQQILQSLSSEPVVFRPHPLSLLVESDRQLIDAFIGEFSETVTLDDKGNYAESFHQSRMLVTDLSGTGFTYAFSTLKPVIFFARNKEWESGKSGIQFEGRHRVGLVARNVDELISARQRVDDNYDEIRARIEQYRNEIIYNIGRSSEAAVEAIVAVASNKIPDNCEVQ